MNNFNKAFLSTMGFEGGYANNKYDPGGETKFGITKEVARKHGYNGDMKDLPYKTAKKIYRSKYWDVQMLDRVSVVSSQKLAEKMFDVGVNMGVSRSVEFLQRSLNAFNNKEKIYDDVPVDGIMGPKTINALKAFVARRDEADTIFKAINCLQGAKYIQLSESSEDYETFTYGWFKRIE